MEGLIIHAVLRSLQEKLPARALGWAFPDDGSAALLLEGMGNLVMRYRPAHPILTLESGKLEGNPKTPFQRLLEARVKGVLLSVEQLKLDRVVLLELSGEMGFRDIAPTRVVFELTGRNANLVVCDLEGKIIGLDRPVSSEVNRFRELRTGLTYTPPPPYSKLDPRTISLGHLGILVGKPLSAAVPKHLDGLGKELVRELARRANLTPETQVTEAHLSPLLQALQSLVQNPSSRTNISTELSRDWEAEETENLRKPLREALHRQLRTLQARLEDTGRALAKLDDASTFRGQGDLLMAYSTQIEAGSKIAQLTDFEGNPVSIQIDPTLSLIENATKLYQRAKRLEANAQRGLELEPTIKTEMALLHQELERLNQSSREDLLAQRSKPRERGPQIGSRYQSPAGFEIWLGRTSKENDLLTRSAHSEDLWFHVQGIPGSHVILRIQGRGAALPDLLYAAQLAAFYSKARGDKNVPVDYTSIKNVWRPRKAAPGQVLYSQAKTLFVDAEAVKSG
jgi:predicted ribosome quality control (RQC) complex YloA/Tae2 family protein